MVMKLSIPCLLTYLFILKYFTLDTSKIPNRSYRDKLTLNLWEFGPLFLLKALSSATDAFTLTPSRSSLLKLLIINPYQLSYCH